MSTFEEIRPEFEISSEVESVSGHAFEGFYPHLHAGVDMHVDTFLMIFVY